MTSTENSTLTTYARQTAADMDGSYLDGVRAMRDEPSVVADDTGISIADVVAWCAEQLADA